MSTQTIIVRCDAPGCAETVDLTRLGRTPGWIRNELHLMADRFIMAFDYCPDHAPQYGQDAPK